MLFRTRIGLVINAVGNNHHSAHALGYGVVRVRYACIAFGGACSGLAGAYLALAYTPQWIENMSAGRGWIALALVVFSTWLPGRLLIGAYLFGTVWIMGLYVQGLGVGIPVAAIVVPALPRHDSGSGHHLGEQVFDQGEHARNDRAALRTREVEGERRRRHVTMGVGGMKRCTEQTLDDVKGGIMKKLIGMVALALAMTFAAGAASAADKLKVGFIYVGPIGDHGWTYAHDQGRLAVEEALGDQVETVYVESVPEGADAERAIERLARQGAGLIFTTSFGYMDPTIKVAKRFPDVKFEHATGYKQSENVASYNARFHEGRYVIGQIAARMSKSGIAGYIASFPIPEVVMGINSFMLGAQSINPDFKVKVVWVNTWFDPGKEADAAKVLIGQGADIITQHTDSTAPLQIAERRGRARLRSGLRHDPLRAKGAVDGDHRRMGPLLHRARPGGSRRDLGVEGHMGRHGCGYGGDGALHQHAG